jgi:hypothetical protein
MLISMKRERTPRMCCLVSFMAKNCTFLFNICFHDGRSFQKLPWDFTLEMGLGTCRWDFALHTGKSHVRYKLLINGLLRLTSWDLASTLRLVHTSGTWDLGPHVNQPLSNGELGTLRLMKVFKGPLSEQTREFSNNFMWDLACLKVQPRVHTHIEAMKC